MTDLMRVAVVRPHQGTDFWAVRLPVMIALTALTGWWLMLILGTVTPWHLSYWHSILTLIGIRMVQVGPGWSNWTHPFKKESR